MSCKPKNTVLYAKVKSEVKKRVNRWPSAYASGQLVHEYKRRGGKYQCGKKNSNKNSNKSESGLARWFKEKWIDICTGKPCGRKNPKERKYPYCRPSRRVNKSTPKTSKELTAPEKKKRCAKKRKLKKKTMGNSFFGTRSLFGSIMEVF
jgi:hypothetical protein